MKNLIIILAIAIGYAFGIEVENYTYNSYGYYDEVVTYNYEMYNMKIENAVSIILEFNKNLSEDNARRIAEIVFAESQKNDLEYSYVMAIIATESRFNSDATSYCGAKGLMQIMPATFKSIANKHGLDYGTHEMYDIEKNIVVGCLYLNKLFSKYGEMKYVAAGYNGGPGAANNFIKGNFNKMPLQTKKYVKVVEQYYHKFNKLINEG